MLCGIFVDILSSIFYFFTIFILFYLLHNTELHIKIYIYIYIYYNAKRESMKDYKCFFYQYSDFHVFTRQSSDENCYQHTNYNIMVSNQNDVTPGGHPGSHHTHGTKPSYKNLTAVIHEMY